MIRFIKRLFTRTTDEPIPNKIHELAETYGAVKMPDGQTYAWDERKKRAVRDGGDDGRA